MLKILVELKIKEWLEDQAAESRVFAPPKASALSFAIVAAPVSFLRPDFCLLFLFVTEWLFDIDGFLLFNSPLVLSKTQQHLCFALHHPSQPSQTSHSDKVCCPTEQYPTHNLVALQKLIHAKGGHYISLRSTSAWL